MAEHTPTPWSIKRAKFPADGQYDYGISAVLMDGKPYCIAETFGRCSLNFTLEAEANAAFIIKACNSHDALVKALRECVQDIVFCERVRDPSFNPRSLGVGTVLGDAIATLDAADGAALPSHIRAAESDAQSLETREVQS